MIFEILFFHYVGDVLLQSDEMRSEKWRSGRILTKHVGTYTMILAIAAFILTIPWWWVLINGILHFIVDHVSSSFTHWFFEVKDDIRSGMNIVVADQLIHVYCLWVTLKLNTILSNYL